MFNFEMVCADGIFQLCDDIVSEKLTKKEVKECMVTFYNDLKNADSCCFKGISFNFLTVWNYTDEQKENIIYNVNAIYDCLYEMHREIYNVFHNYEKTFCPNYWYTLCNTVIELSKYKVF